jgi:hypothetical protein
VERQRRDRSEVSCGYADGQHAPPQEFFNGDQPHRGHAREAATGINEDKQQTQLTLNQNSNSVKGGVANEEFVFKRSLQPTKTVNDLQGS